MGYGAGGLRLTPEGGSALTSGRSITMAAAGTRGELVAGDASGGPSRWRTAVSALCRVLTPLYVKTLV